MSLSRPSVEKPFLLFSFFCVFFVFCFSLSSVVGLLLFGSRSRLSAAILIAAVMTVLLVLRTFLELRWVEVLLILAVSALGYWYFTIQR